MNNQIDPPNSVNSSGVDDLSKITGGNSRSVELSSVNHALTALQFANSQSERPTAWTFLNALRRRWLLALSLGLVCAAVAGTGTWLLWPQPKFTARTLMRIPGGSWVGKAEPGTGSGDQRTHVALIKSRLVLNSALKQPAATSLNIVRQHPDPIAWLEKEIQADFSIAPEVLRISMTGENPAEVKTLVNEVREAYRREVLDKERIEANSRQIWLGQQREHYEAQLRKGREIQRDIEQKTGKDASTRNMFQGFVQQQLNWTERELIQNQSELRRLRAETAVYKAAESKGVQMSVPASIVDELLNRDQEYQKAQADVRNLKSDKEKYVKRSQRGEKDPGFVSIAEKLNTAEVLLGKLHDQLVPLYEETVRKKAGQDTTFNLEILNARADVLVEDEKALVAELARLREKLKELQLGGATLDGMREDMSLYEKMAKRMADDEELQRLSLKLPQRSEVVEDGVVTQAPDIQRRIMAVGMTSAGSMGLVCFLIGFCEIRARRVNTVDEIVRGLGMKLVGTIPDSMPRYPRGKRSSDEAKSLLTEAVDTTRTMLLRAARAESLQVIMVTSAQSGEGKTSLSTHLATSLAQISHTTLFIDGDLRNPIADQVFGVPLAPGLCEVLRGEATLEEVLLSAKDGRPAIITAGRWDSAATRALAQGELGTLIHGLRQQFEFIIIDASPVLPVVDPLLIGHHVDGAILSVMRDVSRMPNVYAAHQRLTSGGVRILGAVVNGVRGDLYGAPYAYKYGATGTTKEQNDDVAVNRI